jgi:hypothetical protein
MRKFWSVFIVLAAVIGLVAECVDTATAKSFTERSEPSHVIQLRE